MKKFDYFLLMLGLVLILMGYNFAQRFGQESESSSVTLSTKMDFKGKKINSKSANEKRTPNQILIKQQQNSNLNSKNQQSDVETEFLNKYSELNNCIYSQSCDFSQDDPRSYELEIYQAINQHLKNIDVLSKAKKEKTLLSAAKLSDGYVKETVLKKLISDKIYSELWRDVILDEYLSHHNSRLIPDVIEYFKLFSSEADKVLINQRIVQEISTGSPMVANALAENIKKLLDKSSVEFYKSRLSNLEDGPIKNNLSREILDFELLSSAG